MISNTQHLKRLVYDGAVKKSIVASDVFLDRINYELSIIQDLGFIDYFILYSRIIEICNKLNILRTYGRGSAANSLVNYCLDITKIDPLEENLVFERFILPGQSKLPDIDIDIPKGSQKQVIESLVKKYPEYEAYCIAFSPIHNLQYEDVVHQSNTYKKHPSGIVITKEKINNNLFLYSGEQFYLAENTSADYFYQRKIDLVELEYLNRLQLIVNEIGDDYHPYKLPLNDVEVFEFMTSGDLKYIFQFNSPPIKKILTEFKPNSIKDLTIINTMFRPGFQDYLPNVIRNKISTDEIICSSDLRVSEILKETYGVLIYQETFLNLAKEVAGIPYEEAELWRRKIFRDKSNDDLITFKSMISNGCRENSFLSEHDIGTLINIIFEVFGYTFQKAHSLSYSIVAYWGAYYKTHFKKQFDKVFNNKNNFQPFEFL
jgi:DNA polymerase-3 subunit alpha